MAASATLGKIGPRATGDQLLAALDPAAVARSLRAAELPPASPTLARRLEPLQRHGGDAQATAAAVLDEPAALLAVYAEAHRRRLPPTADLAAVIDALGKEGMLAVAETLRGRSVLDPTADRAPLARGYRHALATARLARRLAPAAGLPPELSAAAALLHDAGRLALLASDLAHRVDAIYRSAIPAPVSAAYVERSTLGIAHHDAGHAYAIRFGVPEPVAAVTRTHAWRPAQRAALEPDAARLAALVQLCDTIAKAHGYGGCAAEEFGAVPAELAALADDPAVRDTLHGVDTAIAARWLANPATPVEATLRGVTVLLVLPPGRSWSSAANPLVLAGADVQPCDGPAAAARRRVLLVDGLDTPLPDVARSLAGAAGVAVGAPRLVLADRAADPESRIVALDPAASVLTTPVRTTTLIQRVHDLATRSRA